MSTSAFTSPKWVALERQTVLFRDPTNAGRGFIAVLIGDCVVQGASRNSLTSTGGNGLKKVTPHC